MSQSSFVAASLIGGFVLFLAIRGRLPIYGAVLWGDTKQPVPSGGLTSGSSSGGGIFGLAGKAAGAAVTDAIGGAIGL